jgi:stress response protein SCP2
VPKTVRETAEKELRGLLEDSLLGRLGRVWIEDPEQLKRLAVPLNADTGDGGYGTLTTGSRIPIPNGKVVRAFTYWEKVSDIDLSCFAMSTDGKMHEFSWRNMWRQQSGAVVYSGDETSGYKGGSEYFDIDLSAFKYEYEGFRYLVFCDNIYSTNVTFKTCVARAGFMLRDEVSSGEIYEPKTVQTSYILNADSTFSYLFAIDLETMEMVWLNMARKGRHAVAGNTDLTFILDKLNVTEAFNVYDLLKASAVQLVDRPQDANLIVSDDRLRFPGGDNVIRSWDTNRFVELIQTK